MTQSAHPLRSRYDVIIIGGAIMGSAAAWFLSDNPDFDGRVLVIERDMSYAKCSTAHTNSCMRQQFSIALNIQISQFAADYIKDLRHHMGGDVDVPVLRIQNFGYMYLAASDEMVQILKNNQALQVSLGAGTRIMTPEEIARAYPFYALDDILLGSHNTVDEGYWGGSALFECWRHHARRNGVEYIENEVVDILCKEGQVTDIVLASGEVLSCGHVINASGPRAAKTAAMAGLTLPVEPRKRFTYVFSAQDPLDRPLPLTIDPSGIHVREIGAGTYMAGGHLEPDLAVGYDDFTMEPSFWMDHVWPALAMRIPAFEAIKVTSEWAGHYAFNTLDQNAIIGPHPEMGNFLFLNGFSGHGLQQSPAMGRGISEWITYKQYRTLDLSPFHYDRIDSHTPILEHAVI